jgi:lipopolysaccharide assembly protein A
MQAIVWILRFAIVVVLVWFAVKNAQEVTLYGLPDQTLKAPLVFVLLVVFVAGVIIGLLAWVPTVIRQRREIGRLKRAADKQAALASISPPATPPVAPPREPLPTSPDGV